MKLRVEPYTVGDFIHVYNRGNRKMPIVKDINDKWRFLKILRFYNDKFIAGHPERDLREKFAPELEGELAESIPTRQPLDSPLSEKGFKWPKDWPPHQPLVKILSYCLRENHFHLLLKEVDKGGLSFFMKRLGNSFTGFINLKYHEVGRLFQGSYKARTIVDDVKDLYYLDAYIQVFNAFEDCPGGIGKSLKEFDKAFQCALDNPFCSLGESFGRRNLKIIDRDVLLEAFPNMQAYKEFANDALVNRHIQAILGKMTLESRE